MDLTHAIRRFEEYLDDYDREDDKIRLKITHTYGVMEYRKIRHWRRLSVCSMISEDLSR